MLRSALLEKASRVVGSRPFLFFSIIMVLKSYLTWLVIFEDTPIWAPLVTEIPFIWAVFCLIEWFATKRKLLAYLIVNLALTGIFFAAIMYYKYYGVIVTWHALEQVNQVTAVKNSVFSLIDPYFLFIFTDIIVLIYLLVVSRKKEDGIGRRIIQVFNRRNERRGVMMAIFALSVIVCVMNILPNRASMNERVKASEMGILNYEAYALVGDEEVELVDKAEITQAKINELKGITPPARGLYQGWAEGKNLIVIQLESFQQFLVGLEVEGHEITPNLNALVGQGFAFPNFYHMVGQGNTSDAEFVVNTSYYVPPQGAATMRYVDRVLPSLPRLLQGEGYVTATFHTNTVEFWNRGELYSSLGWDRYYDDDYFGTEDSIFFGSSDEVLYRKTAEELRRMNATDKPFYAQVIAMTAHHPYTLPEEKQHITFSDKYTDTFVGDYLVAQHYADLALGQFIDELKTSGVWEDSVVLLYGDHVGLPIYSLNNNEKELMAELLGHEYSYADMIHVPLAIVGDRVTYPATFDALGGQVDLLPTIANLMNIPLDGYIHFGQDLLNHKENLLPQRYYLPSGTLLTGDSMFMPGEGYADGTFYPLAGGRALGVADTDGGDRANPVTEDAYERALELFRLSDSYVRQLPAKPSADTE